VLISLERGFRVIQALLLLGIGGVVVYHRIPLNRNLKSMLVGYNLYVSASLIILALRVYIGMRVNPTWRILQPLSYDAALVVWAVGLWSYSPPPVPHNDVGIKTKSRKVGIMALPSRKGLVSLRQDS
jgi:hypothetical protein